MFLLFEKWIEGKFVPHVRDKGSIFTAKIDLLIMPVVDALAERTEEGRLYDTDSDGLLSIKHYPSVSEWSNPPAYGGDQCANT